MDKRFDDGRPDRNRREVPRRDWVEQLDDYVSFVTEQGRDPSQYAADPRERTLCFWLRNQKASFRVGLLLPERAVKLDELLPGWSSPYRLRPTWEQMLARTVHFKTETGRWPSVFSPDGDERTLANWLYRQSATTALNHDGKHAERIAELDQSLPEWRSLILGNKERWNRRLDQLVEHVQLYGRLPVMGPFSPPEENTLGKWISVQRYSLKKGILDPERLARLDDLLPGWRRVKDQ